MLSDLIRPSGGLYYHGRALFSGKRWQPFRATLAAWLDSWPCPKDQELLLIGPSAGYSLSTQWLQQFPRLHCFDLDPLAAPLFRLRHGRSHAGRTAPEIRFHRNNVFWSENRLSLTPLKEILLRHPTANILFCNVLGQVLLEGRASEQEWLAFLRALRLNPNGRYWGSYHDAFTIRKTETIDHLTSGDWLEGLLTHQVNWNLTPHERHTIQGIFETP